MGRRTAAPRAGFTLIEVLFVIAIISILASLLLVGLQAAQKSGRRLTAANDVSQLATACQAFKRDFGIYPPHLMYVTGSTGTVTPSQYRVPSKTYARNDLAYQNSTTDAGFATIKAMFPRWAGQRDTTVNVTYNAQDSSSWSASPLTSDQCLIFFLAGPGGQGWDPNDPTNPTPGAGKKGPYLDLTAVKTTGLGTASVRLADPWDKPYLFFSCKAGGDYDTFATSVPNNMLLDDVPPPESLRQVDTSPYKQGNLTVNQGSVQIITAGPDGKFGPGGTRWVPGSGLYVDGREGGFDDLANFNKGLQLGDTPN